MCAYVSMVDCARCGNPVVKNDARQVGMDFFCRSCDSKRDEILTKSKKSFHSSNRPITITCLTCNGKKKIHGPTKSIDCPSCNGSGKCTLERDFDSAVEDGRFKLPSSFYKK